MKEDFFINSIFEIKKEEVYIIENKNIHISSLFSCLGTLKIKNCNIYYNENTVNGVYLIGNFTLSIENSTIICKSYSNNFFFNSLGNGNIFLKNNTFIECLNFIGKTSNSKNYLSNVVIENCKFENCIGHFLNIQFEKQLKIDSCLIIQDKLPEYYEDYHYKWFIKKSELFSISGTSESSSIFINNQVYTSKFIKDDRYKTIYSTLISYVDRVENSLFDFEEPYVISSNHFINTKEIKNCRFYRLSNIATFNLIDSCYFWACKSIESKRYSDNSYKVKIQNCKFECCYDTLFDEELKESKYENISPYYTRTLILENCEFSGIKIENYIFKNELIKLGPNSEIKKCKFLNLHTKTFLIDVAVKEVLSKEKKVLIENCIFKDCPSETREKNSIIVKSNWGLRIIRKDYLYTVTEVKDCQFT